MSESDWMRVLRDACGESSQRRVAQRVGLCQSVVSAVLRGKYPGSLTNVETRVRGELMNQTWHCPVLGKISSRRCLDIQKRPIAATNPQRIRLYRECRNGCPRAPGGPS